MFMVLGWLFAQTFAAALASGLGLGDAAVVPFVLGSTTLIVVVFAVGVVRVSSGQPAGLVEPLGFGAPSPRDLLLVIPFFFVAHFLIGPFSAFWQLLFALAGGTTTEQAVITSFRESVANGDWVWIGATFLGAVVFAPITEELVFRGIFFRAFEKRWGFWRAAALSSLVFAGVHLEPGLIAALGGLGILLCYLYARTDNLWVAVVFHGLFNCMSLVALLGLELAENAAPT